MNIVEFAHDILEMYEENERLRRQVKELQVYKERRMAEDAEAFKATCEAHNRIIQALVRKQL